MKEVQKWDDLTSDEKKLFARYMECYAGFMSHTDEQIGRFIRFLEKIGKIENTLIIVCSDNGASAEGMLTGLFDEMSFFNAEPESIREKLKANRGDRGTNMLQSLPCWLGYGRRYTVECYNRYTHYGGTKNPLIVH